LEYIPFLQSLLNVQSVEKAKSEAILGQGFGWDKTFVWNVT
jgi:hypothetical protein